jgi:hypothetical protein
VLDLSHNKLKDAGAMALASALISTGNKSVTSLIIDDNVTAHP